MSAFAASSDARGMQNYETGQWAVFPDKWAQDIVSSGTTGDLYGDEGTAWDLTPEQTEEAFTHPREQRISYPCRCSPIPMQYIFHFLFH